MKNFEQRLKALPFADYQRIRTLLLQRMGWTRNIFMVRRNQENFTHTELQILAYTFGCTLQDLENENYALKPEQFKWEDQPIVA